ncbi:MAG: type I 3-dehydroquinate dehydratase [Proteobacteria bacterium]|nr:type I 3-dehydroquinate dehydratase [Pseudomonadota bacterium]
MICVSIGEGPAEELFETLKRLDFAEIRMDMLRLTLKDVHDIFSINTDLIATYRPGATCEDERKQFLIEAIESGAAYVDIEVDSNEEFKKDMVEKAKSKGCKVIVSFHDYEKTPDREELLGIVSLCFESGGDIAKIACKVNTERDNARLLGLLDSDKNIVVTGMGEKGGITRIIAPLLGSPFTYAAPGKGKETADGQLDIIAMKKYLGFLAGDGTGREIEF